MAKVLVFYDSIYGHIETMAKAVAEGVRSDEGIEVALVALKRVPDPVSEDVARKVDARLDQEAPIFTVDALPNYDISSFDTPILFGNMMCMQMYNFHDQIG